METLLSGVSKDDDKQIGATNYYHICEGDLVCTESTEYFEISNLYLLWCEEPGRFGLCLATVDDDQVSPPNLFAPSRIVPTGYARAFAHGALAELGVEVDRALFLGENFCRRSKNWFARGHHSHLHRGVAGGFGYRGNLDGGLAGWDAVRELLSGALLRHGALASYANARANFFGSAVSHGKDIRQCRWNGAVFASLEHRGAHQRLSRLHAMAGGGYSHSRTSREDRQGDHFSARFGGAQALASLEGFQGLFHPCHWQIGPRVGVTYNWQRQNGYVETSTATAGAASIGAMDHHFLTTALGIGLSRDFLGRKDSHRCGQISSALTWNCQAVRHHGEPAAHICGTALGELAPTIAYGTRNSAAVFLEICRCFDRHWSGTALWQGDFARGKADHHLSAQLCFGF
jgi:hypothetical protein